MTTLMLSAALQRRIEPKGRILAIEPDPVRAATLRDLLPTDLGDFTIVTSVGDAIRAIATQAPDLVLTSTFLPPAEEAALTARLRQLPVPHLQVITVPHFIDSEDESVRDGPNVLKFLKRRSALMKPGCDSETVRKQIEAYLEQAHALRLNQSDRESRASVGAHGWRKSEMSLVRPAAGSVLHPLATGGAHTYQLGRAHANDRRRARRQPSAELSTLLAVKLPWGADVQVVDISSQGVLLETTSKINAGRTIDLRLIGQGVDVSVPARTTRSEVASVDAMGVRYRVAAVFARNVDGLESEPHAATTVMPTALADLLARVLTDVDYDSKSAGPRARFEQGLRRLVPVRDVQIRQAPLIPSEGSESIYFTVPSGSGHQPILQAIFEPDHRPSAAEFRLLKAAANLAAVVLEFAPLGEDGLSRAV